ncbi:MAG: HD-GYP domain-containing protein, partial [Proteobacteria bacterium]|nr:HD-GYP domain-containing protein [Pseudomonadota bacterium]
MRSLYPPGHPAIFQQVEKSFRLIDCILEKEKKLAIAMVEDVFIIQNEPFYEASELFSDFIKMFNEKKVEKVIFHEGLTLEETSSFYEILALPKGAIAEGGGIGAVFSSRGLTHIVLARLEKKKKDLDREARLIYADAMEVMIHVTRVVRLGNIPSADRAKDVISEMVDVVLEDKNAILGLTMIKGYDDYLFNHSVNVSILAIALGQGLGFPESTLNDLGVGALLHDIGKTQTPEAIVKKAGHLDDVEWDVMKKHPSLGYEMLIKMRDIHETSANVALEHHLRYDHVDGYPREALIAGPNLCSQVVTVADCYDALTTLRPYQEPLNPNEALKIMEKLSGTTLNPQYYKNFVKVLGIYPAGTLVRLDTN